MTCRLDACCQGRKPCPAPAVCSDKPEKQIAAEPLGVECALPIVADTLTPVRRWDWRAIGYWSAILAAIAFGLLIGTSHG